MRKYWITTQWPPEGGTDVEYGVWLYDGTEQVGELMEPGDRVWIYQSKGGRRIVRQLPGGSEYKLRRQLGKEGVIALAELTSKLHASGEPPEKYDDGSKRWWKWKADARLVNQSGFVPRVELNSLLGYRPNYGFRAFGDDHSGVKRIDETLHQQILQAFSRNQPRESKPIERSSNLYAHKGHGEGGEGPDHRRLKERVADDPAAVLGEEGLALIQKEYPFPTGDRADVLLRDSENRYVAVEVEVAVDLADISGVLQAIKYSSMYAIECRRRFEEVRAFLVAHSISAEVETLCNQYGIETFVVAP